MSEKISLEKAAIRMANVTISGHFVSEGRLPPFRGATLRGALGFHLRKTVCNNFKRRCQDCFLVEGCAYANFFDGVFSKDRSFMKRYDYVPQPYMLMIPLEEPTDIRKSDPICFSMNIFGGACELFPYVAYSLVQMGEKGIGKNGLSFEITRIEQLDGEVLYEKGQNRIKKPNPQIYVFETAPTVEDGYLGVRFVTPVRIRKNGCALKDFCFDDLIKSAIRRITIMNYFYGTNQIVDSEWTKQMIHSAGMVEKIRDETRYYSFHRYSGRQERKIELDGVVGGLSFKNVTPELAGILKWTEKIGLGKSTSFGFGRIEIQTER